MEDIKKRISKLVDLKSIISIIMVAAWIAGFCQDGICRAVCSIGDDDCHLLFCQAGQAEGVDHERMGYCWRACHACHFVYRTGDSDDQVKHRDHQIDRRCRTAGKRVQRFHREEFSQPSPDLGTQ